MDNIHQNLDTEHKSQFTFKQNQIKGELILTHFKNFPKEWKLEITTNDIYQDIKLLRGLISIAKEEVKNKGGTRLVSIVDNREDILDKERAFRECNFDLYFIKVHSKLNLTDFNMSLPETDPVKIMRWSQVYKIDHSDPKYLQKLEELYQVEYEADYEVRETGRWDMYNPDPHEFVTRFTSNEAKDEFMVVALHEGSIMGLTYPWEENSEETGIFFTGTIPQYTGKGIATALKIRLAQLLKEQGYKYLVTNNRESNAAILRTNDKLDFQRTYEITFLKHDI